MESEQHHYELRSRSRSRSHTPMIPTSRPLPEPELTERHYDLRSWSRERSRTPGEVTSSRRSGSRSLTGSMKTHEKSMETIEESKEGSVTESLTDNQSTKSDGSVVVARKAERRSERQRAKRQIFANGQSESKEGTSDQRAERRRRSVTPRRVLTSDYSSEEGEREDPPSRPGSAYAIYKRAGEWWNVFPKTDYTYSPTSQCRYEIAPGVLAMPNMSRRSIHASDNGSAVPQVSRRNLSQASRGTTESGIGDVDTVDLKETAASLIHPSEVDSYGMSRACMPNSAGRATLYKRTHLKQYTSHKEVVYSKPGYSSGFRSSGSLWNISPIETYDSDLELDETFAKSSKMVKTTNQSWRIVRWFAYFTTFIVACFRKTVEFFEFRTDKKRQHYVSQAYRSSNVSKWSALWQTLDRYTHNMYFFFVRILVFDAWLLSRFTGVRKWLRERGPKVLWLALLPLLLLLGGWCVAQCLLPLSDVGTVSETATERLLPDVQREEHNSKIIKEILTNNEIIKEDLASKADLINRIKTLENRQTHQMEHLINITRTLEDRKQIDADFRKEYDDKITNVENKLDVSELKNMAYSELQVIKHEFEELRKLYAELKSCCDVNAEFIANQNVEKHVERILLSYFPSEISKEDLVTKIRSLLASHGSEGQKIVNDDPDNANVHISDEHIRKIVRDVLRIYDADKTGQVDYALETAGGQILGTRCTQQYDVKSRALSLFGFFLYSESGNPRTVIQGNPLQPGVCWAFQDFPGQLIIQLRSFIYVTGFTLEHVSRLIVPDENMSSAPKKFNVWGLLYERDPEPVMFGEYEFTYPDESLQYFPVQNTEIDRPYEYIELRIHSNHGQLEYTCLYRFRVHGRPA
ncbi:PREDICTED: uncharacterized protein LOC105462321 [Wasmannia auropunctata]|uniref:uncharacterized protein LOC105462321 n=1 Tax=Wasmannia auropunctata TaxID=64793 RepID=UPI0005EE3DA6|nr:PREDICTED: uncharacterized protein LOC105462321 [Wasmannia auropunctata]XP_011707153.1 PREDICTED: uncharacterized protein LOC105462321 [Wasmannia auropunctata]XP_011707159.1 PREDICTED: uncharacterized protein LOC105462321 [Wasmannia auropunctata]XP_011707165.1 PREDICTED: uncharacterized protein LOC105462321 [Wasmannia auropunctata]XP_011707172.1 PREDICTED: uncharacterized protein LOC105462321 [Wasmannia auropunctata]